MPHFFFHLHDGKSRLEDSRGVSLPDAEAAWYQAFRNARDIVSAVAPVAGRPAEARHLNGHALEVEDELGRHVWTLPLVEIAELLA